MKPSQAERFCELLGQFDTAVLITHGFDTFFRSRPMLIARIEDNGDLWFITSEESAKVHEIEADTRVHVVCQHGRSSCVTVTGHASLRRDRVRIHEFWKPGYLAWFPDGPTDRNIVLIHVAGEHGEYWDNTGINRITYLYRALKAMMTGTKAEVAEAEQHGHVTLAHGHEL